MKILRFLAYVGIITLASLVYVWQQVQLVELNYRLLKTERQFTKLIDQNRILKYNVAKLKCPEVIEKKLLASAIDLKYSSPIMITQLDRIVRDVDIAKGKPEFFEKTKKTLTGMFALRSQVEAKP